MSSSLILRFGTMSGEKNWTFSEVDSDTPPATVKTLMDTMITNGSIYKYPPMTKISAKLRTVTEDEYDISD